MQKVNFSGPRYIILHSGLKRLIIVKTSTTVGERRINLLKVPPYFGKPWGWTIDKYKDLAKKEERTPSLFNCSTIRGWWPLETDDPEREDGDGVSGRVDVFPALFYF